MENEENLKNQKGADEIYCSSCGKIIKSMAEICPNCGVRQLNNSSNNNSSKDKMTCLLFYIFLGCLGFHRYYVGKIGTGLLYAITFGGLGILAIVDFITIITGNFKDIEGKLLK